MRSAIGDAVHDLFGVWRETRLIVLVAQTAAIYAAVLIPFKVGIPLIPGFAELRPANALPIVASLLFGPAAAWGAGFGNLIGDCFGTLSPASAFGFVGNFFYGYVPYLLWGSLGPLSSGHAPEPRSWRQIVEFVLICAIASLACAVVIGWGVDWLGLVPFKILTTAIFFNNLVMALLLAPPLLLFLGPRVRRWGLRYQDIKGSIGQPETLPQDADPSASPTAFVDVRALSFTYQGTTTPALQHLSLQVTRGESVALMGKTGAGKSTLCYALNGLIPKKLPGRFEGQIFVDHADTATRPVWRQAGIVGLVFQDFETQLISTTLLMEVAFPLEHVTEKGDRPSRVEMRQQIARALDQVGLSGLEHRDPLTLSGGQRQRLVLATVLVRQPEVLVLDEPFTDLDPRGRQELTARLRERKRAGATLIIAEHDPEEAVMADTICVLDEGTVTWRGTPGDLFGNPDGPDLARRLGIVPLPLAACFEGRDLSRLPVTVEEAWDCCDHHGLTLTPKALPASFHEHTDRRTAGDRNALIEVRQASFEYVAGQPALRDVTLTIHEGEFVALLGQNGSGKTTLASLMKGLRVPTQGSVTVQGTDTRQLSAGRLATMVGYVFQNPDHQIFAETVEAEVSFGVKNLGYPPKACEDRVTTALQAVGLGAPEILRMDPFSLTKGDRQRVAVASILAARPGIVIFDEPSTGLDGQETLRMMNMIRQLNEQGHTIVMITHTMSLVSHYARRCVLMRNGRIEADGVTRDIFARLLDPPFATATGLQPPPLTRFAARWGLTLLTVEEVRQAMRTR